MPEPCSIHIKDVTLEYDLHYDRTNSLKELVINAFHRRKYVDEKVRKLKALNNVSLEIKEGERVGIIGLNGSGKSTLLKVISGILKPTQGSVTVNGSIQPLIEIGAGFNPEFSGRENIYLNGYMLGFMKKEIKAAEKEIVDFTDLGHFIDVPIKYYSSGMSVRLAFTIATMIRPEILVFDEMLSAGDAQFIEKAKKRMDELVSSAKMLVLVSHDLGLVKSLASRVIVMKSGQMVFEGRPDEAIQYYEENIVRSGA
jgi:ABC-type polysaccharide/polyol phosphate transport system ATPase subunit